MSTINNSDNNNGPCNIPSASSLVEMMTSPPSERGNNLPADARHGPQAEDPSSQGLGQRLPDQSVVWTLLFNSVALARNGWMHFPAVSG